MANVFDKPRPDFEYKCPKCGVLNPCPSPSVKPKKTYYCLVEDGCGQEYLGEEFINNIIENF